MKKKWIISLLLILTLGLAGCSTKPTYYSKEEVEEYVEDVFGKDFSLIEEDSYLDDSDEKNPIYEYIFENDKGIKFSVYAYTYHVSIDASQSIFYDKSIKDNYIESIMKYYENDIKSLCASVSFDASMEDLSMKFFLDDYKQIPEAAKLIARIDHVVSMEYDYHKQNRYNPTKTISIFLKPNDARVDWKEEYEYQIAGITLSFNQEKRLNSVDVATSIEQQMANKIKEGEITYYSIPDEILYKYPARKITITSINNHTEFNFNYGFLYDEDTQSYWISNLDPCQDFEDFPYNYTDRGKFAEIVKLLGGTYQCDDWSATWIINNNTWEANLITKENSSEFQELIVRKNGELIQLSDPEDRNNGTTSGRAFTKEDIEQLLDVEIIIDQRQMNAIIKAK